MAYFLGHPASSYFINDCCIKNGKVTTESCKFSHSDTISNNANSVEAFDLYVELKRKRAGVRPQTVCSKSNCVSLYSLTQVSYAPPVNDWQHFLTFSLEFSSSCVIFGLIYRSIFLVHSLGMYY